MDLLNANVSGDEILKITAAQNNCFQSDSFVRLVKLLAAHKQTLSVAESCTGGLIGKLITDVSGASSVFCGGMITYTNEVKINNLGVRRETIDRVSEVSFEVAAEMAQRAREVFKTDFAISATGFAGPDGEREDAPVGTVFVSVASCDFCYSFRLSIPNKGRDYIRRTTAEFLAHKLEEFVSKS